MSEVINGETKFFGVIADPIDHVRAPTVFNRLWKTKKHNYIMVPINVSPESLESVIEGLREIKNFGGFCVTIPHKIQIAKICNELMPSAIKTGAVNAAFYNKQRELIGDNFDGQGFVAGLIGEGIDIENKDFFIVGAGGAARGIILSLADKNIKSITLTNRTLKKSYILQNLIKKYYPKLDINVSSDPKKGTNRSKNRTKKKI